MKAELWTRCGCVRTMTITSPAPPQIEIPLRPLDHPTLPMSTIPEAPDYSVPHFAVRVFERSLNVHSRSNFQTYHEVRTVER